jgi:hypothetical protein
LSFRIFKRLHGLLRPVSRWSRVSRQCYHKRDRGSGQPGSGFSTCQAESRGGGCARERAAEMVALGVRDESVHVGFPESLGLRPASHAEVMGDVHQGLQRGAWTRGPVDVACELYVEFEEVRGAIAQLQQACRPAPKSSWRARCRDRGVRPARRSERSWRSHPVDLDGERLVSAWRRRLTAESAGGPAISRLRVENSVGSRSRPATISSACGGKACSAGSTPRLAPISNSSIGLSERPGRPRPSA